MWFVLKFTFLLFSCVTATKFEVCRDELAVIDDDTKEVTELQKNINKITNITNLNENLSRVEIQNNVRCQVYLYDPDVRVIVQDPDGNHPTPDAETMRVNSVKFYYCLNCKFAEFVENKLYALIELVPLSYNSIFSLKYDDVHRITFQPSAMDGIVKHVEVFTDVLFNFLNVYTYPSLLDTSLLKSLVSLQFSINCVRGIYARVRMTDADDKLDDVLVPRILGIVNAVYRFRSLNCDALRSYDNKQYYGYSNSGSDFHEQQVADLLTGIRPLGLENNDPRLGCSVERMLMDDVLKSENLVAKELKNVTVELSCKTELTIEKIYRRILEVDDFEVLFWYQSIIVKTIVYLLVKKMCTLFVEQIWNYDEIIPKFRSIKSVLTDPLLFPIGVIDLFQILASNDLKMEEKRAEIRKNVVNYINHADSWSKKDFSYFPEFKVRVDERNFDWNNFTPYLDATIDIFKGNGCFMRLFGLLNNGYQKYYLPQKLNTQNVYSFVETKLCEKKKRNNPMENHHSPLSNYQTYFSDGSYDKSVRDESCDLMRNLHQYCFESIVFLGGCRMLHAAGQDKCKNDALTNVQDAMKYLYMSTRRYRWGQATFAIFNLKEFTMRIFDQKYYPDQAMRLLKFIMTTLDAYGLNFCRPPNFNFLMSNNVDFDTVGLRTAISNDFDRLLLNNKNEIFENYRSVFNGLIKTLKSNRYGKYDGVRFYWKGGKHRIQRIYESIVSTVTDPSYVYALFDVYFKFWIAAVFHETEILYKHVLFHYRNISVTIEKIRKSGHGDLGRTDLVQAHVFPGELRALVTRLNAFIYQRYSDFFVNDDDANPEFHLERSDALKMELMEEFHEAGVFVHPSVNRSLYEMVDTDMLMRKGHKGSSRKRKSNGVLKKNLKSISTLLCHKTLTSRSDVAIGVVIDNYNHALNDIYEEVENIYKYEFSLLISTSSGSDFSTGN